MFARVVRWRSRRRGVCNTVERHASPRMRRLGSIAASGNIWLRPDHIRFYLLLCAPVAKAAKCLESKSKDGTGRSKHPSLCTGGSFDHTMLRYAYESTFDNAEMRRGMIFVPQYSDFRLKAAWRRRYILGRSVRRTQYLRTSRCYFESWRTIRCFSSNHHFDGCRGGHCRDGSDKSTYRRASAENAIGTGNDQGVSL